MQETRIHLRRESGLSGEEWTMVKRVGVWQLPCVDACRGVREEGGVASSVVGD